MRLPPSTTLAVPTRSAAWFCFEPPEKTGSFKQQQPSLRWIGVNALSLLAAPAVLLLAAPVFLAAPMQGPPSCVCALQERDRAGRRTKIGRSFLRSRRCSCSIRGKSGCYVCIGSLHVTSCTQLLNVLVLQDGGLNDKQVAVNLPQCDNDVA